MVVIDQTVNCRDYSNFLFKIFPMCMLFSTLSYDFSAIGIRDVANLTRSVEFHSIHAFPFPCAPLSLIKGS